MTLCYPSRKLMSQRVRVVVDALLAGLSTPADLQLTADDVPPQWLAA